MLIDLHLIICTTTTMLQKSSTHAQKEHFIVMDH